MKGMAFLDDAAEFGPVDDLEGLFPTWELLQGKAFESLYQGPGFFPIQTALAQDGAGQIHQQAEPPDLFIFQMDFRFLAYGHGQAIGCLTLFQHLFQGIDYADRHRGGDQV